MHLDVYSLDKQLIPNHEVLQHFLVEFLKLINILFLHPQTYPFDVIASHFAVFVLNINWVAS